MVFNRFWRADPARARTSGGTGLGLSIALEDTHLHGGWLQAWGRPGEGAQFRLTLPRRGRRRAAAQPAAPGARPTSRSRSREPLGRAAAAALAVAVVALLLAGCVRMPDDGPVVETRSEGGVRPDPGVFIDPRPPQEGDTRPTSSAASSTRCRRPRSRPTPPGSSYQQDAAPLDARAGTITYADASGRRRAAGGVSVDAGRARPARPQGAWQGPLPPASGTIDFPMAFEDGEWRIDDAPDALIVPETWFAQRYRPGLALLLRPDRADPGPEPVFVPRASSWPAP